MRLEIEAHPFPLVFFGRPRYDTSGFYSPDSERFFMSDHVQSGASPGPIVDKKDLAAVWAVGVLFALLLSLVGFAWEPAFYEPLSSSSVDPMEARIENSQNKTVSDALNEKKIQYDPSMAKLVRLRPWYLLFLVDFARLILFPVSPILIIGFLLRKTAQQAKAPS
jgi:hypothetical protein